MKKHIALGTLAALVVTLSACSPAASIDEAQAPAASSTSALPTAMPSESESAEPVEEETTEAAVEETTEAAAEKGTRENPGRIGKDVVTLSSLSGEEAWEVVVTDVNLNANKIVAGENMFNEPPADGNVFVIASLETTYLGDEVGNPWVDIDMKYVSAKGRAYDVSYSVIPNDLTEVSDLYKGATAEGDLLFEVPKEDVDKGTLAISDGFSDDAMFIAVK